MIDLHQYRRAFTRAPAQRDLIQVAEFANEHSLYTKPGGAVNLFRIRGADDECLTDRHKDQITERMLNAHALFDRYTRHFTYVVKQRKVTIAGVEWNGRRVRFLEEQSRGSITLYQAIEPVIPFPIQALAKLNPAHKKEEYRKAIRKLTSLTHDYLEYTSDVIAPVLLEKKEAFRALWQILAPREPAPLLARDTDVDLQLCGIHVAWDHERECLRVERGKARVFTLLIEPSMTRPNLWGDLLAVQADMVIATSWQAIEKPITLAHLEKQRHLANNIESFHGKASEARSARLLENDPGLKQIAKINLAMDRHLEEPKHYTCWLSLTIVLHGALDEDLDTPAAKIKQIFSDTAAQLLEELGTPFIGCVVPEYFGILPGAAALQTRPLRLENHHYADVAFPWAPEVGNTRSSELDTDYDNVYLTRRWTPFYKDTHYGKRAFEFVCGASGSGKTVYQLDRLQAWLARNPYLYIFDVGHSYEPLMRSCGATVTHFSLNTPPRTNPLQVEPTPEGHEFVFDFVRSLAETGDYRLTTDDEIQLHYHIRGLFELPNRASRRLGFLRDALTGDLRHALTRWCEGGQYGVIFDNVDDELEIAEKHLFGFDETTKGHVPDYVEPLKALLIYRMNSVTLDPANLHRVKILVLDEAQIHTHAKSMATLTMNALETWRKHNGMISILTPAIGLLGELGDYVIQATSSWVFFQNKEENPDVLRDRFRFDEKKLEVFRSLKPKEFLLHADETWIVLKLLLDEERYQMFTTSPLERYARDVRVQSIQRGA